ncbi:Flp family type IVb pilin [Desulforudis sp. 1088]|uniref:Flp family type IVb pilin n=1 Tax=unclassified Candidatus Desulforudis TaxID=2635950 RepID=UPI003CE5B515
MFKTIGCLWKEESGQGMVEYGLVLALMSLIALAGLKIMAVSVKNNLYEKVANSL